MTALAGVSVYLFSDLPSLTLMGHHVASVVYLAVEKHLKYVVITLFALVAVTLSPALHYQKPPAYRMSREENVGAGPLFGTSASKMAASALALAY